MQDKKKKSDGYDKENISQGVKSDQEIQTSAPWRNCRNELNSILSLILQVQPNVKEGSKDNRQEKTDKKKEKQEADQVIISPVWNYSVQFVFQCGLHVIKIFTRFLLVNFYNFILYSVVLACYFILPDIFTIINVVIFL